MNAVTNYSVRSLINLSLVVLALSCSVSTSAQEALHLTLQLVDSRISAIRESEPVDQEALGNYEKTIAFLRRAETLDSEAAGYVNALKAAPTQRAAIQYRLDKMEDAYDAAAQLVGFSQEEFTARLALARSEQSEQSNQLATLEQSLSAREIDSNNIQARLSAINARVSELPKVALVINDNASATSEEASQFLIAGERVALRAERRALEAQLSSQPVRYSLMAAARAESIINLNNLQALIRELESRVSTNEDSITSLADLGIEADDPAYLIAVSLMDEDNLLHDERQKVNAKLQKVREQALTITRASRAVDERFATAKRVVDFASGSDALGRVLLTYWDELEDLKVLDPTSHVAQQAGDVVIGRITHEQKLAELISASSYMNSRLRADGINPETVPTATRSKLMDLTRSYRERLRGIIVTESEYLEALAKLSAHHVSLVTRVTEYTEYLEGFLLWIPNHPPLWMLSTKVLANDFRYIAQRVEQIAFEPNLVMLLALIVGLALFRDRRRLKALQQARNEKILRPLDDSIRHTLFVLVFSMLRALPLPLLLLGISSGFDPLVSPENELLNNMFSIFPAVLFTFGLMRLISEPLGLGRVHFNWSPKNMQRLNRELKLLIRWWLPLLFATIIVQRLTPMTGDEAIGQLLILLTLLVLAYHIGISQVREIRITGRNWFTTTVNRLRFLLVAFLTLTIACVIWGLVFTAVVGTWVMINTLWISIILLLTHSLLLRWLKVASRRLRFNELMALRVEQTDQSPTNIEEKIPDLGDIRTETQQLITTAVLAVTAVALYYVWAPLLPVLDGLSRVDLWTSATELDGETVVNQITMTTLLTVVVLAAFTLFAAKRLPALVEMVLRSGTGITPGARYTISTLLNYVIIAVGAIAGLSALGLQWNQLQWLVAALGVGIGFGLQEIVANFVSGLIILFERPIRVGDIISIGEHDGIVIKIRIRATTIQDWDGRELLVPNKEFISGRLLNWTLSDSLTRWVLPVGIAYGSDVEKALRILAEVVSAHPQVLKEPPPSCFFIGFGDNSLNLQARFYISKVEERFPITSALLLAINNAFNAAGIVIAFPQRDIHFDPDKPLRIAMDPPQPPPSDRGV